MARVPVPVVVLLLAWLVVACTPTPSRPPAAAQPAAAPPASAAVPSPAVGVGGGGTQPADRAAPSAGGATVAQPVDPPQRVRVDSIGIAAEAPIFLAIEQGYFRELGLEIEQIRLQGSAD